MCRVLEGGQVCSDLDQYGRGRSLAHPEDGLEVVHLLREELVAHLGHPRLAFHPVAGGEFQLVPELGDHFAVHLRDHTGQRGLHRFAPLALDSAPVHLRHEPLGVGDSFGEKFDDFAVTLAVHVGHVVVQPDVAPLQCYVKLGQFVHDLPVQVGDTAVVLPQLLDGIAGNIAPPYQNLQQTGRYL